MSKDKYSYLYDPKWQLAITINGQLLLSMLTEMVVDATSYCKSLKLALDVGGNIGFWSKDLAKKFEKVVAFEPHPENVACYKKNNIHKLKKRYFYS